MTKGKRFFFWYCEGCGREEFFKHPLGDDCFCPDCGRTFLQCLPAKCNFCSPGKLKKDKHYSPWNESWTLVDFNQESAYCVKCGRPRDIAIAGPGKSRWRRFIGKMFFGE